ncbi:MAG: iron-containing alcohol dehydrogenase [Rikenellaceae bacterium]
MKTFSQFIPTRLYFGAGSVNKLSEVALPGKKALIVISAGTSMRKFGYLDKVTTALESQNVECVVFDKILPNPIKEHVMEASELCRRENCDFVVGLGGGSSIDSAKSIAVMACNDGDYWDYIHGGTGKGMPPVGGALPIIAITTTAGTGTETDPWTVITNENQKIGYGFDATFPVIAIVDPELMLSVPSNLTAYQGFDAFFHSAEGYIATSATPISELYSLKSIELIYKSLPTAVADGSNIEARGDVALANTLAGMVESTSSCNSEHSLEHAMSAYYPALPHGAGLISISLEYFRTFMADCPEKYMAMATAMTGEKSTDPNDFITALATLQERCGVDNIKLSEWGVKPEDFPKLGQNARETMPGLFTVDPRPITDAEIQNIFEKSFK